MRQVLAGHWYISRDVVRWLTGIAASRKHCQQEQDPSRLERLRRVSGFCKVMHVFHESPMLISSRQWHRYTSTMFLMSLLMTLPIGRNDPVKTSYSWHEILSKNWMDYNPVTPSKVLSWQKSGVFNEKASTTTIPAQLVKKYRIPVVPIFIERFDDIKFKMTINKPINFEENKSVEAVSYTHLTLPTKRIV